MPNSTGYSKQKVRYKITKPKLSWTITCVYRRQCVCRTHLKALTHFVPYHICKKRLTSDYTKIVSLFQINTVASRIFLNKTTRKKTEGTQIIFTLYDIHSLTVISISLTEFTNNLIPMSDLDLSIRSAKLGSQVGDG